MALALASAPLSLPLTSLALLVLGAPVAEELLFRDGLQEALLERVSPTAANAWTAAAFALMHGLTRSWWLAAAVVVPAVALGCLYQRERRVAPCAAAHAAMNLVWIGAATAYGVVVPGLGVAR
ncbi:MAG: JDVT-CTERM system CAAX-type protease [Rhizobacter sp.]|nr:JDVT-CTERM system CAAX-type protease [Rhizobacter sp.]